MVMVRCCSQKELHTLPRPRNQYRFYLAGDGGAGGRALKIDYGNFRTTPNILKIIELYNLNRRIV